MQTKGEHPHEGVDIPHLSIREAGGVFRMSKVFSISALSLLVTFIITMIGSYVGITNSLSSHKIDIANVKSIVTKIESNYFQSEQDRVKHTITQSTDIDNIKQMLAELRQQFTYFKEEHILDEPKRISLLIEEDIRIIKEEVKRELDIVRAEMEKIEKRIEGKVDTCLAAHNRIDGILETLLLKMKQNLDLIYIPKEHSATKKPEVLNNADHVVPQE